MNSCFLSACIVTLIVNFLPLPVNAQTNIKFDRISVEQGLSNNSVWAICQDGRGFMWFGTMDGLSRYDGRTFKVYRKIPDDSTSLDRKWVNAIHEDGDGNLWIGSGSVIYRYNRDYDNFTRYPFIPRFQQIRAMLSDSSGRLWIAGNKGLLKFDIRAGTFIPIDLGLQEPHILSIVDDALGNLWLAHLGGAVIKLEKNTLRFKHYLRHEKDPGGKPIRGITDVYLDKFNMMWICSENGLIQFDRKTERYDLYERPGEPHSMTFDFRSMCEDSLGRFWMSTFGSGLKLFDRKSKVFTTFKHISSDPSSLSSSWIFKPFVDRTGNLWVPTDNGINLLARWRKPFTHVAHNTEKLNSLVPGEVRTIHEDSDGILWVGAWGGGLSRFDRRTGLFVNYKPPQKPTYGINVISEDRKGTLWFGSEAEGLVSLDRRSAAVTKNRLDSRNPLDPKNLVYEILEDRHGILWVGTQGGICRFDRGTRKSHWYPRDISNPYNPGSSWVTSIYEDRSGTVWVGSGSQVGLYKYDRENDRFIKVSDKVVRAMYEDKAGRMWLGTNDGFHFYNREAASLVMITENDRIGTERVIGILEDDHGNLWLCTDRGLTRYNPDKHTIRNYDVHDGYPFKSYTYAHKGYHGYSRLRSGEMVFGVGDGFVIFHPDSIRENPVVPPAVITEFKLFNEAVRIGGESPLQKAITETQSITLSHNQNALWFEFAALDYLAPQKNQYAYMLEGLDKDWVPSGNRNFVQYTNLPAGEYIFHVKGSNNDGVWNEHATSIAVIIAPPWWGTTWAYVFYGLFATGFLFGLRRSGLNRQRLKQQMEMERFQAENLRGLDQMKSRFFANISHEFRTPLTLIQGPIEKLLSEGNGEETNDQYRMIQRNSSRLLTLVNQLLDLSKVESGQMRLRASEIDIVELVRRVTAMFESLAVRKKIRFTTSGLAEPIIGWFDRDAVEKIVTNLLTNAFKFTPADGEVKVTVGRPARQESSSLEAGRRGSSTHNAEVEIRVSDTGIGIPTDSLHRIFDRFYQVDDAHTRDHEGTGIGLALTKELVELHKGHITVESEVGRGSTFTIRLRLGKEHLRPDERIKAEEEPKKPESVAVVNEPEPVETLTTSAGDGLPSLLIVEDNADMREYMRTNLYNEYRLFESANGIDGMKTAQETMPDLIISDVMMPKMDGIQMCEKLKTDERTSHIPVILLTARASSDSKLEGLETGADDYITKPFDAKELQARVKNLIEQRRKLRERFRREGTISLKEISITSADERFLKRATEVVESHIAEQAFSTELFAKEMFLSRMQLHRKIKALTDHSPGEFVRLLRLERASQLLRQRAGTIAEIAYQVGFDDPAYFSEAFHRQFGLSPTQFMQSRR